MKRIDYAYFYETSDPHEYRVEIPLIGWAETLRFEGKAAKKLAENQGRVPALRRRTEIAYSVYLRECELLETEIEEKQVIELEGGYIFGCEITGDSEKAKDAVQVVKRFAI